jgi:AraC family transcriptional regulator, arabinose operon regulatory protein
MQQVDLNFFENISIKNLICRVNVCAPDWHETDCMYAYNKFYYFLEGEATLVIQGDEYHPQPGELFMIPANTRHTYFHNIQKPVYKYWCHFDFTLNEGQKLVYHKDEINCLLPRPEVTAIFDKFVNLDVSNNPLDTLVEKSALLELLKLFLENVNYKSILHEKTSDFICQINDLINKNIKNEITLKQMADVFHLHPNYFIQYFKKHFSVTPIEYVNSIKLQRAAQLLTHNHDKSINQVAYEVGFNDYRYFTRLFKKKYGLTPSSYKGMLVKGVVI